MTSDRLCKRLRSRLSNLPNFPVRLRLHFLTLGCRIYIFLGLPWHIRIELILFKEPIFSGKFGVIFVLEDFCGLQSFFFKLVSNHGLFENALETTKNILMLKATKMTLNFWLDTAPWIRINSILRCHGKSKGDIRSTIPCLEHATYT